MDMHAARPIGAALALIQHSTSGSAHRESSKPKAQPSAAVKDQIAKLGLRYPATSQTDRDAHAARLATLCDDLAEMPAKMLERAIKRWALKSPYMPKASELVALARDEIAPDAASSRDPTPGPPGETLAQRGNRLMTNDPHARRDIMWMDDGNGGARLAFSR